MTTIGLPWGSCIMPTVNPATMSLGRSVRHWYFFIILQTGNRFERKFRRDCAVQHLATWRFSPAVKPNGGSSGSL